MIVLIDYGAGNLHSVHKAIEANGGQVHLGSTPQHIFEADKVILPGVGAFGDGIKGLEQRQLIPAINEFAASGRPLLGICLGMQLLLDSSEEMGQHQGLELIPGKVVPFTQPGIKVPQIGWNQIDIQRGSSLLANLQNGCYAYFNHSYYCQVVEPEHVLALTDYGSLFASIIQKGNIYGVQFHPEKSQEVGMRILRNFVEMEA